MKAFLIKAKDDAEAKLMKSLLKKMNISSKLLNEEEIEDIGMGFLMAEVDKKKKAPEEAVMRALKS